MHINDIYKRITWWLHDQKQPAMAHRNFMMALGKLQEKGIIENKDGYCQVKRVGL